MPTNNARPNGRSQSSSPQNFSRDRNTSEQGTSAIVRPSSATLNPEVSAALRDQLAAELEGIGSAEEATTWARRVLAAKGTLLAADAKQIEGAFQEKLNQFEGTGKAGQRRKLGFRKSARRTETPNIDKNELSHPEPRRIRDREHIRFVTKQPCLLCGRKPSDPHHLRFAQRRALGRKVSDEFTVPLCRGHHREVHRCGDEAAWWQKVGVDPTAAARALWLKTHPLPGRGQAEIIQGPSATAADSVAANVVDAGPSFRVAVQNDETILTASCDFAQADRR